MKSVLACLVVAVFLSFQGVNADTALPMNDQTDFLFEAEISEALTAKVRDTLAEIPDPGRRLLALRSYVRAGSKLEERWSWSEEEIEAFQGSLAQKALLDEVEAIRHHFAENNPGYEIYVNTKVRSLEVQLENWNKNESVGVAGNEILTEWLEEFGRFPDKSKRHNIDGLRKWIRNFKGEQRAHLAAPGLTLHGRALAIDFQILKDGKLVAEADSRQIEHVWRAQGWDEKLNASITAAGPSFSGPLKSPDEPWHYNYDPSATNEVTMNH